MLGQHYTLIVPDLPGHGRSSNFPGDFSHREVGRLMFALADELGFHQVRGIGHSSGAFVLIHMGVQQPERVAAMVLIGGTHRSSLKHRTWVRSVKWEGQDDDTYELWRQLHPGGEPQLRAMMAQWRKQADDHPDFDLSPEHLAIIQARTLIVLGDRDSQQSVESGVEMYRAISQAALWVAPGEGHDAGMQRDPEGFARAALRFLGDGWPA
jgi:pimeloyl-ACP methyl ester carboxylesterase